MPAFNEKEILEKVIEPSLEEAEATIPFFSLPSDRAKVVLYGSTGALLDSLNLVSFVFIIEEKIKKSLKAEIKITTQDVLDTDKNPFASIENLNKFLYLKLNG